MKVDEKVPLADYYNNRKFQRKIPDWSTSKQIQRAGDNIYFPLSPAPVTAKDYEQLPNPHHSDKNKVNDIGGQNALIATEFVYFGGNALTIPPDLRPNIPKGQSRYGSETRDEKRADKFIEFVILKGSGRRIHAPPHSWPAGDQELEGLALKIILSRKGFDSSAGGHTSPILPDGKMLSLPIPSALDTLGYDEITAAGDRSLRQIIDELDAGARIAGKGAHLDPDLLRGARSRLPGWCPTLGQISAAATHLHNQGVSVGDLFLFYGWFRHTEKLGDGLRFRRGSNGYHVIFGYLEIGEIIRAPAPTDLPPWLHDHPHAAPSRMAKPTNTVYVATQVPSLQPSYPGAGVFRFDERILSRQIIAFRRDYMPNAAARVDSVSGAPRNDMEVEVKNSLTGRGSMVEADVETISLVEGADLLHRPVDRLEDRGFLGRIQVIPPSRVTTRHD